MYITINDIIGGKRIDLSYLVKGKDIAVVSMLNDNVQYQILKFCSVIWILFQTQKR